MALDRRMGIWSRYTLENIISERVAPRQSYTQAKGQINRIWTFSHMPRHPNDMSRSRHEDTYGINTAREYPVFSSDPHAYLPKLRKWWRHHKRMNINPRSNYGAVCDP